MTFPHEFVRIREIFRNSDVGVEQITCVEACLDIPCNAIDHTIIGKEAGGVGAAAVRHLSMLYHNTGARRKFGRIRNSWELVQSKEGHGS